MISYNALSKIGFGTYRTSNESSEHAEALRLALSLGENLIDTANSYKKGESERLIGSIIHEFDAKNIFIISKAGYIPSGQVKEMSAQAQKDSIKISDTYSYSIHPDFLDQSLELSTIRLKRPFIDCYMLHNPEYQLSHGLGKDYLYRNIEQAFIYFEEQVKAGKIRCYGISSNTFAAPPDAFNTIDFTEVLKIATRINANHNFKMIQFPFNLIENNAFAKKSFGGKSLIEMAQSERILTIGNRPLNANAPNGTIRLANYNVQFKEEQLEKGEKIKAELSVIINAQISKLSSEEITKKGAFLPFLFENWDKIGHTQSIDHIFQQQLFPFVNILFQNTVPDNTASLMQSFLNICRQSALNNMDKIAVNIKKQLEMEGAVTESKNKPLQALLCEKYLESGINHILVGMRHTNYVKDLSSFF